MEELTLVLSLKGWSGCTCAGVDADRSVRRER